MPYYNSHGTSSTYNKDGVSSGPPSTSGTVGNGSEPTYLMEHLATFTVTIETGIVYPADGMRRLLQLEKSNGIWSQKMQLRLERSWVLIMDNETGAVMERFPASLIQEPTAFTSRDPMEMYNNILVFTVADDSASGQRAEMHIFQCQSISAQDLVEDLKMLQIGKLVPGGSPRGPRGQIPPPPALPPPEPPVNGINVREQVSAFNAANNEVGNDLSREENIDEVSSTSSEKYERDVTILNHCFDDIEKFIARLQHAAAASRELERRRRNRKSKKRNLGDGMLTMRAKPPPEMEFVDIFQKFKLSFNLLAKLKAHIHDPNAPELVHFLFTPLALIVDASHDTNYDPNLPNKVVSPLLTREAVNLLINCVTSKETELWHSLGDTWLIPRDQWKGHVPLYHPIFMDGWSPEYPIPEDRERDRDRERDNDHLASLLNADKQKRDDIPEQQTINDPYYNHHHHHRDVDESNYSSDYLDYEAGGREHERPNNDYFDRNYGPPATPSEIYGREEISRGEQQQQQRVNAEQQTRAHSEISLDSIERGSRGAAVEHRAQEAWLDDLLSRNAKIVQVTYPRTANNDKELTVVRGEYLELLDDSRKWWKARNAKGQIAHVPHTIVTPHNSNAQANNDNDVFNNPLYTSRYQRQGHGYNYEDSEVEGTSTSPGPDAAHRPHAIPPPAPADWVRKERLGKKVDAKDEQRQQQQQQQQQHQSDYRKSIAENSKGNDSSSFLTVDDKSLKSDKTIRHDDDSTIVSTNRSDLKSNSTFSSNAIGGAPPPPPPPPPIPLHMQSNKSTVSSDIAKTGTTKSNKSIGSGLSSQDQMQEELKYVLTVFREKRRNLDIVKSPDVHIDPRSSPNEVQNWLQVKGFSEKTCKQLRGIAGNELFSFTKRQLEQYIGQTEGRRLDGQITLSRNVTGYKTTRSSELKQILEKMRHRVETEELSNENNENDD